MKNKMRRQEGTIPWINLLIDLVGAYVLTMVILLLLAFLVFKVDLTQETVGVVITFTYMLTCFLAGNLAGKQTKQKRFMWGGLMGVAYYIILLIISLIINGSFAEVTNSLFTTLILCAGGGMIGGMLS